MTRERPITARVRSDAYLWAVKELSLTKFCEKHKTNPNTGYRMLASALAEIIKDKE